MKCYSLDGEDFSFTEFDSLVDEYNSEERDSNVYYEADAIMNKPSHYFRVDNLLEDMACQAHDDGGEHSEEFPDLDKEQREELENIVSEWLDKNCSVNFWQVVNVVEKKFEEVDYD